MQRLEQQLVVQAMTLQGFDNTGVLAYPPPVSYLHGSTCRRGPYANCQNAEKATAVCAVGMLKPALLICQRSIHVASSSC